MRLQKVKFFVKLFFKKVCRCGQRPQIKKYSFVKTLKLCFLNNDIIAFAKSKVFCRTFWGELFSLVKSSPQRLSDAPPSKTRLEHQRAIPWGVAPPPHQLLKKLDKILKGKLRFPNHKYTIFVQFFDLRIITKK
ncbi:hypothetical protein AAK894_06810 [Lachnospiraceae bacterium 46-61]